MLRAEDYAAVVSELQVSSRFLIGISSVGPTVPGRLRDRCPRGLGQFGLGWARNGKRNGKRDSSGRAMRRACHSHCIGLRYWWESN